MALYPFRRLPLSSPAREAEKGSQSSAFTAYDTRPRAQWCFPPSDPPPSLPFLSSLPSQRPPPLSPIIRYISDPRWLWPWLEFWISSWTGAFPSISVLSVGSVRWRSVFDLIWRGFSSYFAVYHLFLSLRKKLWFFFCACRWDCIQVCMCNYHSRCNFSEFEVHGHWIALESWGFITLWCFHEILLALDFIL